MGPPLVAWYSPSYLSYPRAVSVTEEGAGREARTTERRDVRSPAKRSGAPVLESEPRLQPFIKWPGGKSQELPLIAAAAPPLRGRLIDPFVGGGAVLLATPDEVPAWANDICPELIGIYDAAGRADADLQSALIELGEAWDRLGRLHDLYADLATSSVSDATTTPAAALARHRTSLSVALEPGGTELRSMVEVRLSRDLEGKFKRMRRVEGRVGSRLDDHDRLENVEGAVRAAFYYAVRSRYNTARAAAHSGAQRLADFFFLREFAYAAMFRFNATGAFNVPYGGVTYNRKSFAAKASALFSSQMAARLRVTDWRCMDFETFLGEAHPTAADFVFVDPPYDSDFSSYDDRPFIESDQERLHNVLASLSANVMVVIKDTPLIRRLYGSSRWQIAEARKTYMWTIKSRNVRQVNHLLITNY